MASAQRLELSWANKDKFLLAPKDETGKPRWVETSHPAAHEVRLAEFTGSHGAVNGTDPYADNLIITGDALDAMRVLVNVPEFKKHYRGKVRLIYIDPPFNTGSTFTAYDDWMEHSTWLAFMRDRLLVMRDLLSPDGSIWVHLDEGENHRMRCLMDEVFGAENYFGTVVWQRVDNAKQRVTKKIAPSHDTILIYSRAGLFTAKQDGNSGPVPKHFDRVDEEGRPYCVRTLRKTGSASRREDAESMWFPIIAPDGSEVWPVAEDGMQGHWRWGKAKVVNDADLIDWLPNRRGVLSPYTRFYYVEDGSTPFTSWWPYTEVGSNRTSKSEIRSLFPGQVAFDTPKPEALLQRIIHIATDPGDTVVDVFGGSGTTAAVAHKMGRQWVSVEASPSNNDSFVIPRLARVVDGEDWGGITVQSAESTDSVLPAGVTSMSLKATIKTLTRLMDAGGIESDNAQSLLRDLKSKVKGATEVRVTWHGGGGFRTVRVEQSMYEVDEDGQILLASWATNGRFSKAVAGQLGFTWQSKSHAPFCGIRGRMRLAVLDGAVGLEEVRHIVSCLGEGQRVTIVAKSVLPDSEDLLRELSPGSRIRKAPRDLLGTGKSRSRRKVEASDPDLDDALLAWVTAPDRMMATEQVNVTRPLVSPGR